MLQDTAELYLKESKYYKMFRVLQQNSLALQEALQEIFFHGVKQEMCKVKGKIPTKEICHQGTHLYNTE